MEMNQKVQILQAVYAGALADATLQLGKEGVLAQVTARKREEQLKTGQVRAAQFGITRLEDVFLKLAEVFGCANWSIENNSGNGFTAHSSVCKLCALAKKIGASSPCHLYCLDPMEGMIKGLNPEAKYTVEETLWSGTKCSIKVQ
jgi:hypothetical protein